MGVRFSLLLYSSLIALGQIVFTIGLQAKSWPIIFLGRLIFGFGGESFTVANSALLSDWFKGRELAFAFGVNLAISKLGSVFNNLLSPQLADQVSIGFALWFGAILCGLGIGCVLLTLPIDRAVEKELPKYQALSTADDKSNPLLGDVQAEGENRSSTSSDSKSPEQVSFRDALRLPHIFWVLVISCVAVYGCILPFNNISSSLLLERDYFKEPSSSCQLQNPYLCESDYNQPTSSCPSSTAYQPPLPYNATVDGEVYNPLDTSDIDCSDDSWKNGCTEEYCHRQQDAISKASVVMSIPYIISACLSPPLGYLVDIYGFRAVISLISPIILIAVHASLGYSSASPVGPLVGQGLAYTGFVSVLWPSIPLVVEEDITGLAFGIVTSMQNLATALIPLIVAQIYSDSGDKYIPNVELLFVILAIVGVFVGLYLNYYDYYYGNNILNSPALLESELPENEAENRSKSSQEVGPLDKEEEILYHNPMVGGGGAADTGRAVSVDAFAQERAARMHSTDRAGRHSSDHSSHHPHHRKHRGTSFTAYEEVMRGGGYRTVSTSRNSLTHRS